MLNQSTQVCKMKRVAFHLVDMSSLIDRHLLQPIKDEQSIGFDNCLHGACAVH